MMIDRLGYNLLYQVHLGYTEDAWGNCNTGGGGLLCPFPHVHKLLLA